jgi:hypothetical protein
MTTPTGRQVAILDNFDEPHEAMLALDTRPRSRDDGYTWRGQIIALEGDDLLARIKSSSLASGCTMLTADPEGRFEVTLRRTDAGGFTALGVGAIPFSSQP